MSRYIDAEKIEGYLQWRIDTEKRRLKKRGDIYIAECCSLQQFKEYIEDQPTADVEEVKHGKDIYYTVCDKHCEFKCSVCNAWIGVVEGGTLDAARDFNYCPACGAKIDKEKEE